MAVVVAFNGTRLNDSDANTGWGNYIVGGGAPSSEFPLAYQVTSGTTSGAVNKKIISTTARQGVDFNGSAVDFTAAANRLFFCKIYVADAFDLNATWGVEISLGSADTSNYHQYNVAGSGANLSAYSRYPDQGGYLITAIDPTVDTWAENIDVGGAFDQTAVVWYAVGAQFVNGTAKSENVAFDAIDYGTGLTIDDGVAGGPGTFQNLVTTDQNTKANRWGVVTGSGNIVRARGVLTIGSATQTTFTDNDSIVLFPDGYPHQPCAMIAVALSHASSAITINSLLVGEGTVNGGGTEDTRPDFIVTGTSGTFVCGATLRNFRNVTLTSASPLSVADVECQLLTQASADIENCTIRTNALVSVACLQDPTFGTTTDLNNTEFIQTGAGHAIELATVDGTFNFTELTFTGYGATGQDDAALDVTAASGTTTINITGGTASPTYKTAGATVNIVASVNVNVHVKDVALNDLQNVDVYIQRATPTALTSGAGNTAGNGALVVTETIEADQPGIGFLSVNDRSLEGTPNPVLGYRYASHDGASTFTFPTTVSGTSTNAAPSALTLDASGTNFQTEDYEEGDTIRNTTDGSFAIIDEIVSATQITTTPLQGGTSNDWTSGDAFSVHDLATTLVSGTDLVDAPLFRGQTDSGGDITTLAYDKTQAPTAIVIRCRSNAGATKYIPFSTTGTISATDGFTLDVTLAEDTIAT